MKKFIDFLFFIFWILYFSFNFHQVKAFGINKDEILLIFFLKEQKETQTKILSDEDYMKNIMFRELYSTFNIGFPNQKLKFYYEMNEISSSISKEFYLPKKSTTYKLLNGNKKLFNSQELFPLDKNKDIDNFTFILKENTERNNSTNYNSLGFCYSRDDDSHFSFLSQLKNKGFIKKRAFSFLFGDDSFSETKVFDGQLLLGDYPHSISPYFNEKDLQFISLKEKEKWIIEFDSVKYNNDELKDNSARFDINLNVMIGPENFRKKLISSFFYELLENGKCKENSFTSDKDGQTYIFYSFDNSIKFKEIPNLSFFSKSLNETFKISFKDLFILYNGKYFFRIIFNKEPKNEWVFGQNFFNTYKFVFDLDEGRIGYYKLNINNNGIIIIIFCVILFSSIFGIAYLRGYLMRKNDTNFNNKKQIPYVVRKEYSQIPEVKETVNNKKDEKEERKEVKPKAD